MMSGRAGFSSICYLFILVIFMGDKKKKEKREKRKEKREKKKRKKKRNR